MRVLSFRPQSQGFDRFVLTSARRRQRRSGAELAEEEAGLAEEYEAP